MPQDLTILRNDLKQRLDVVCAACGSHTACDTCYVNKLLDAMTFYRRASSQINATLVLLGNYMLDSNKNCKKA